MENTNLKKVPFKNKLFNLKQRQLLWLENLLIIILLIIGPIRIILDFFNINLFSFDLLIIIINFINNTSLESIWLSMLIWVGLFNIYYIIRILIFILFYKKKLIVPKKEYKNMPLFIWTEIKYLEELASSESKYYFLITFVRIYFLYSLMFLLTLFIYLWIK